MPETRDQKPEGPQLSVELEWGLGGGRGGLPCRWLAEGAGHPAEVSAFVSCSEVCVGGDEEKKAVSQQVSIGL